MLVHVLGFTGASGSATFSPYALSAAPAARCGVEVAPLSDHLFDFEATVHDNSVVEPGSPDVKWPLVGRTAELRRVSTLLRAGPSAIVLAGAAGVGKTRLATECLEVAVTRGFVPLKVAGTQRAAGLSFGAFASLVPELASSTDLLELLGKVAYAVVRRGKGKPVAVLVDDAHLLDPSSAALTHLLATTRQTFVLATLRSGEHTPDAIVALWKDGLAERIELHPFAVHDVEKLLSAALRGAVDGAAVHLLHRRTQGNVLHLREVVLGALEVGALRQEEGIWRLVGTLPASSRLVEIIENRLGGLDEPGRRALEVLALGEPLEVELLQVVESHSDLEALERRGLMRIEQDGRRLSARLAHPLYGEVLRARLSRLRFRKLTRALADALTAAGARRREDTLRLAVWTLEGGGSVQPDAMYSAATTARQRYDFPLAERLARAAVGAGAGFEAGLLLAQVCWCRVAPRKLSSSLRHWSLELVPIPNGRCWPPPGSAFWTGGLSRRMPPSKSLKKLKPLSATSVAGIRSPPKEHGFSGVRDATLRLSRWRYRCWTVSQAKHWSRRVLLWALRCRWPDKLLMRSLRPSAV